MFVGAAALAEQGAAPTVAGLPSVIGEAMAPFGWAWNGFYAPLPGDEEPSALHVSAAFGPPVCSPLERGGGALSSGMCFDGFLLNQTSAPSTRARGPATSPATPPAASARSRASWSPCAMRTARPWPSGDLDSTERIEPGDVRAMDVLFASLARTVAFDRAHFQR